MESRSWASINRADENLRLLEEAAVNVSREVCIPTVDYDAQSGEHTYRISDLHLAVPPGFIDAQRKCVSGLRDALDLAIREAIERSTGRSDEDVRFPILLEEPSAETSKPRPTAIVHGIPGPVFTMIEQLQPYWELRFGRDPEAHHLALLDKLHHGDIGDPIVVLRIILDPASLIEAIRSGKIQPIGGERWVRLENNAATVRVVGDPEVNVKIQLSPEIVFDDVGFSDLEPSPAVQLIQELRQSVVGVIDHMESSI